MYSNQWALKNTGQAGGTPGVDINIEEGWEYTSGNENVKIAVIDGRIESSHEDLENRIEGDVGSGNHGHGTNVAGIIAANTDNSIGIAGINQESNIVSKYIDSAASTIVIGQKIVEAVDSGLKIIYLPNRHSGFHWDEKLATVYAYNMNAFCVASSGNDGINVVYNPCGYDNVFCVGAHTHGGGRGAYSNYHSSLDVVAPGGYQIGQPNSILSTTFDDNYTYDFGETSAATAHVAGVASLLLSYNPNLWNDDIANILRKTAIDGYEVGYDEEYGWGRIDAGKALKYISTPNVIEQETIGNGYVHEVKEITLAIYNYPGLPSLFVGFGYQKEIRKDVNFNQSFTTVVDAWGRGAASLGFPSAESINPNYGGELYSGVVEGSITPTGMTVRTFVFELWDYGGSYAGYFPCAPEEATMAYTVVGSICQGTCGDANNDGSVDVSDVNYIVNYAFNGGDPPVPVTACGDANADASVNTSDSVYIINFIFAGGAPPSDCNAGSWGGDDCCPYEYNSN